MTIKELDEKISIIKNKALYFKKQNLPVHITKKNRWFHNGKILEIEGDMLILDDLKKKAMPIYFIEIEEIEKMEGWNG